MNDDSLHLRMPIAPGPGDWLVVDAAWPKAALGVWNAGAWKSFVVTEGPVTGEFFAAVEKALSESGTTLSSLSGYIFAEGPGSVLGLRTAAMALRAWNAAPGAGAKPVLACNSLALAAALAEAEGWSKATVFAASRRDRWNAWVPGDFVWRECDGVELVASHAPHLRLPARDFSPPPVPAETFDPTPVLGRHPEIFLRIGLLAQTDAPDAANLANQYATWAGGRHRA